MEIIKEILPHIIAFIAGGGILRTIYVIRDRRAKKKSEELTFDQTELAAYKQKAHDQAIEIMWLRAQRFESPIIKFRRVDGKFEWVSNEAMLELFEPLGIKMSDIKGKTLEEVFHDFPDILRQFYAIETKARIKGTFAGMVDFPQIGRFFTVKCKFFNPELGITYECEMIPEHLVSNL